MSEIREQVIEKSVEVNAPIDRVWKLLTDPAELPRWWESMEMAEFDLEEGGQMTLTWKEHGVTSARVVVVDKPIRFSYLWAANAEGRPPSKGDQTLVEFRLQELGDVTRVTVTESGFESLSIPEEERAILFADNNEGWGTVLGWVRESAE